MATAQSTVFRKRSGEKLALTRKDRSRDFAPPVLLKVMGRKRRK